MVSYLSTKFMFLCKNLTTRGIGAATQLNPPPRGTKNQQQSSSRRQQRKCQQANLLSHPEGQQRHTALPTEGKQSHNLDSIYGLIVEQKE